ncbi:hypothetical protein DFH11DRAFT_1775303 [Phellopilus nigrolimitatus]|nr:hypothetical protein DFH11DRAFT_1775303 [Phellopilus nigrolimitatus]
MALAVLPLDILDALCLFLAPQDLTALAAASKRVSPFAHRYIYRSVALHSLPQAVRYLRSLRARPDLAPHVRVLSLRLDPHAPVLHAFVSLLAAVLPALANLSSLDLVIPPAASRALFAAEARGALYARLRHFSCNLPLDDPAVCSFLQRLPAARELQLGERAGGAGASKTPTPALPAPVLPASALPRLALFMGPSDAAAALVPGRPLESVHLYSGELTDAVVAALARSAAPITVFGAFTHALAPATLQGLAAGLPHLHHLRIMTMYHHAAHQPDEMFYGQVVQILSTLPELATAELAGIRWAPRKDAKASRAGARVKSKPSAAAAAAAAAARNELLDASDSIGIGLY